MVGQLFPWLSPKTSHIVLHPTFTFLADDIGLEVLPFEGPLSLDNSLRGPISLFELVFVYRRDLRDRLLNSTHFTRYLLR